MGAAYRTAHETVLPSAYQYAPSKIYHSLNPHPALTPIPDADQDGSCESQARNESLYRQLLVQGALATLLPTEDLQNACLRTLVSDIVADLILGQGISEKACEGWFLHEACIKIVQLLKSRIDPNAKEKAIKAGRSRLEKSGLLTVKDGDSPPDLSVSSQSLIPALFWRLLQYAYLISVFARFVIVGLSRARSLPSRLHSSKSVPPSPLAKKTASLSTASDTWSMQSCPSRRPILDYRLFTLFSTLLGMSARMPWLTGLLSWCKHSALTGAGRLGATDSLLDK